MSSLETRQDNRRIYDNYVCRRIPGKLIQKYFVYVEVNHIRLASGKQAVLVLSCDNGHMAEDVMVEPGLVMIFAHGVSE